MTKKPSNINVSPESVESEYLQPSRQAPKTPRKGTKASKTRKTPRKRTKTKPQRPKRAPAMPKPGTPAFAKLVSKWYDKAKASGFNDLERPNPKTGLIERDNMMNGVSLRNIADRYSTETERFYALMRTFNTFNPNWGTGPFDRLVALGFADGESYQSMAARAFKAGLVGSPNRWHAYAVVQRLVPDAMAWNKEHPNGLLYEPDV